MGWFKGALEGVPGLKGVLSILSLCFEKSLVYVVPALSSWRLSAKYSTTVPASDVTCPFIDRAGGGFVELFVMALILFHTVFIGVSLLSVLVYLCQECTLASFKTFRAIARSFWSSILWCG